MFRLVCCLLVLATCTSPVLGASGATADEPTPEARTVGATPTTSPTPHETVVATDGTFGGFTLGAALLAVVATGSYRYLRD